MEVEFEDVSFGYDDDTQVLHGIDLRLEGPGLVCVIGPNGVGKSTLIKCINRLLRPTHGSVKVDGRDVSEYSLSDLSRIIGYVPVSGEGFAMTVLDTVLLGRHPYRRIGSLKEDMKIVHGILDIMNLGHLSMRNFNELSAGQHQRVAIAMGLAQEPEILVLDEPTSNLDIRHQIYVTELLKAMAHTKNMMVIMISHDINITARYADEIVMMTTPGRIYRVGKPHEVITEDTIRYVYGVESTITDVNGHPNVVLDYAIPDEEMRSLHGDM